MFVLYDYSLLVLLTFIQGYLLFISSLKSQIFHIASLPFYLKFIINELTDSKILLNAYYIPPSIAVVIAASEKYR